MWVVLVAAATAALVPDWAKMRSVLEKARGGVFGPRARRGHENWTNYCDEHPFLGTIVTADQSAANEKEYAALWQNVWRDNSEVPDPTGKNPVGPADGWAFANFVEREACEYNKTRVSGAKGYDEPKIINEVLFDLLCTGYNKPTVKNVTEIMALLWSTGVDDTDANMLADNEVMALAGTVMQQSGFPEGVNAMVAYTMIDYFGEHVEWGLHNDGKSAAARLEPVYIAGEFAVGGTSTWLQYMKESTTTAWSAFAADCKYTCSSLQGCGGYTTFQAGAKVACVISGALPTGNSISTRQEEIDGAFLNETQFTPLTAANNITSVSGYTKSTFMRINYLEEKNGVCQDDDAQSTTQHVHQGALTMGAIICQEKCTKLGDLCDGYAVADVGCYDQIGCDGASECWQTKLQLTELQCGKTTGPSSAKWGYQCNLYGKDLKLDGVGSLKETEGWVIGCGTSATCDEGPVTRAYNWSDADGMDDHDHGNGMAGSNAGVDRATMSDLYACSIKGARTYKTNGGIFGWEAADLCVMRALTIRNLMSIDLFVVGQDRRSPGGIARAKFLVEKGEDKLDVVDQQDGARETVTSASSSGVPFEATALVVLAAVVAGASCATMWGTGGATSFGSNTKYSPLL